MQYPNFNETNNSMVSKYLTKDVFDNLVDLKTESGFTLEEAINSGVKNQDSSIGVYAGDKQSYELFGKLFNPIIKEYHGFDKTQSHKSDLNCDNLNAPLLDDMNKYIVSTRIRVGRNIKGMPLGPAISNKQRLEIEKLVSSTLNSFEGELKGEYFPINGMSEENQNALIKDHFLFKEGDRFLEAAGLNKDWPKGRGIFHNFDKTFLVWINEEDQLRIISMQKGGDIKEVFQRLLKALSDIEKELSFSYSNRLGFITSCPTNLGTAMRASVHIKLPNLSQNRELFEEITSTHYLQIRGIHGEHSSSEGGVFDISNRRRLGVTEVQCVQDMYDGVIELIKTEKLLESKV